MINRRDPPSDETPHLDFETTPAANLSLDAITGFLDRKAGLQAAELLVADANSSRALLAAIWLDIDRFRQVNESFGHKGGDSVIARIADRIRSAVRLECEFSRMGSDEFVVLVPGLDRADAAQLAGRLLVDIERPLHVDELLIRPSASIGIAMHQVGEDPVALLERADRAMIEAKRAGGNRLVISGDELWTGHLGVQLAREELAIESALHAALERGGLRLHFQPVIGPDGRVEAVEALMRCYARGHRIDPARFIPVAEKTGLIVRLGEWSLLQGTRCAARLRAQGTPTKLAINVSRAQLTSPKFIQALHAALICADVPPDLVELELTESLIMDSSETVQANLRSVREVGVGLAIDDFGTGYSCLSNLKDLPATKLKLDRSFVGVLPEDQRSFAVVKAMTQLARELGMAVVAEGVETREQLAALAEAGVDASQGFYHARPMPEHALLKWMNQRVPK
jgi:diguanylate cyclase (GGDEF)-like protein